MMRYVLLLLFWICSIAGVNVFQNGVLAQIQPEIFKGDADLTSCLKYALEHQPVMEQLKLRDEIVRKNIGIALSDWLPQAELSANYQYYLKQPVSIFPDFENPEGPKREVTTGVLNTSSVQFSASQVLYSPEVLTAGKTAKIYRRQSLQSNYESIIDLVVGVSKAYYDVLLTEARLDFFLEDRARIDRSLTDARSLYESGLNDKIDFQRAEISLNNIDAEIRSTREETKAKYALLKELMGYPPELPFSVASDSASMMQNAWLDTTESMEHRNRIEYQLLLTNLKLQQSVVNYNKMEFLPSVSAYANYNLVYQNDSFQSLYDRDFPNSSAGLRLTLPLFEGTRRIQQVKLAKLRLNEMELDTINLKNRINSEFESAMAAYKSNLNALNAARKNARLADEIYNTVRLQYNQGIKSYLEVIISEADLRSSRINELNSLYRLISSKLDVDAALGKIPVNY